MLTNRISLLLVATIAVSAVNAQEAWSRFRGANGSGIHSGHSVLAKLTAETKPQWRKEVPFGRSSPIVVGELIVLTASDKDFLLVHALHANGEVAWSTKLERKHRDARYKDNDSASASPASDGESVYAFFPELGLVALDLKGKVRWQRELPKFDSFYGMSSSPVVAGQHVVLQCDQESGSYLLAVDKVSGEIAWRVERPSADPSWCTPVVQSVADKPSSLVLFSSFEVTGINLTDGSNAWKVAPVGTGPVCSPVVAGSRLFVCVKYHADEPMADFQSISATLDKDKNGRITMAEAAGTWLVEHFGWIDEDEDDVLVEAEWTAARKTLMNRDHGLVAFDIKDPKACRELWRSRRSLPEIATPIVYRDVLYTVMNGGVMSALDAATGKVLKKGRLEGANEEFYASPIAADGKLCFASHEGKLVVVDAGANWTVKAIIDLKETLEASPAFAADGSLLVRTAAALYRFH